MANVSLGVLIGGAVGASFGRAISDSSAKIDSLRQRAEKVRGFQSLIGDTMRLREEMAKTANKSGDAFSVLRRAHDANVAKIKDHGLAVDQLAKDYDRLGRAAKGLELGAMGSAKIGEGMEHLKSAVRVGAATAAAVTVPAMASANYQAIVRDIAIKGGVARTGEEASMSESIRHDATASGIDRNELAQAVNTLVGGGMKVDESVGQAKNIARFAVSQNADSTDTAKLVLALRQAGITDPKAMENALGKVAVAGDLGSFEAKDMAKHFPKLLPQMTALGMSGEQATVSLANMLQTQMKAAGSPDEAATNLDNLLSKINSEDTRKKFKDNDVDLKKSMEEAVAQGYDQVTAFLSIVEKKIVQTDPAKAERMAALQQQIAKTQDPAAAQKMLDGYLAMSELSELISDRQAKQAALAALQNKKLHDDNLKKIQTENGQAKIEKDLADRRATSLQKWNEAGQAMDEVMARIGDAIRPMTDFVAESLISVGSAISGWVKEFPGLIAGVLGAVAAFATFKIGVATWKIGTGMIDVMRGAAMVFGAGKIPGGIAGKGVAGKMAGALGAVMGGVGTPVFVTNWPIGGFGAPTGGGVPGGGGPDGKKAPKGRTTFKERFALGKQSLKDKIARIPKIGDAMRLLKIGDAIPGVDAAAGQAAGQAASKVGVLSKLGQTAGNIFGKIAPHAGKIGGALAVTG
ncbi:phage tail tape measure protein, partial [Verminephrobacter aporrectodeae subsp. tuberculatae]